ncbi:unnamed protein product [Linum tenue]|uniref:Uncharacterized protein n=1 Tax=Linum tenue TaxID=586396 RepID=A0AAV0HZH6_9ROSI|nr:unnamed protein product [Linum tenue]
MTAGSFPYQEGQQHFDYHILNRHAYSEGIFYWVFDKYLMAFDMGSDVFHRIDYPFDWSWDKYTLSTYRDSIALFTGEFADCLRPVDVWLLRRRNGGGGGGEWDWIRHSIPGPFSGRTVVMGYWKDDQVIAETSSGQLVLLDIYDGGRTVKVLLEDYEPVNGWHVYRECLAPNQMTLDFTSYRAPQAIIRVAPTWIAEKKQAVSPAATADDILGYLLAQIDQPPLTGFGFEAE